MKLVYFYSKPDLCYGTDLQTGLSAQTKGMGIISSDVVGWGGDIEGRNSLGKVCC